MHSYDHEKGGKGLTSTYKKSKRPIIYFIILVVAGLLMFTAYMQKDGLMKLWTQDQLVLEAMDKEKALIVKVAAFDEKSFIDSYGLRFNHHFPNIEISVVPWPDNIRALTAEKAEQFMEQERPDLLFLPTALFERLAGEGRLYPLDAIIQQDQFDIENLYAGVIDSLRSLGGGTLYGLSPEFDTNALFYNRELFDQYAVPYPEEGIRWDDVLELAGRFPKQGADGKHNYGLTMPYYMGKPHQLVMQVGKAKRLDWVNPTGLTITEPAWRPIWDKVMAGYMNSSIYLPPQQTRTGSVSMKEMYEQNPFLIGQAAMSFAPYSLINDMQHALSIYGMKAVDWDVVHEPIDSAAPDRASSFQIHSVFAVNDSSDNKRAAWELFKLIHSEESNVAVTELFASPLLSTRPNHLNSADGRSLEAFYSLKPEMSSQASRELFSSFQPAFESIAETEINAVLAGQRTLDEALTEIYTVAQASFLKHSELK